MHSNFLTAMPSSEFPSVKAANMLKPALILTRKFTIAKNLSTKYG